MGEYFPISHSPFPYNFTLASDYFPLTAEEANKKGYLWEEKKDQLNPTTDFVIDDNIEGASEDILEKILTCEVTKRPYKIQPQELAFYIKQNVPVPRRHPDQRYLDCFNSQSPLKLWHRQCMKEDCQNEFETAYAPGRPEKVYCENVTNSQLYKNIFHPVFDSEVWRPRRSDSKRASGGGQKLKIPQGGRFGATKKVCCKKPVVDHYTLLRALVKTGIMSMCKKFEKYT